MLARDAVVATQMALGLGPEGLDAVDAVALISEQSGMVDPHVGQSNQPFHRPPTPLPSVNCLPP